MKKYQPFSFRGCGYVQDLALNNQGELGLQIEVIQIQPNDCPDTITLIAQYCLRCRKKFGS
jgi:hypothetical protein